MQQRRSIRLNSYDYSLPGLYFVTICVHQRLCLFGNIVADSMRLNSAGKMVEKWYFKTVEKFPEVQCLEMVIMPNHLHCIWQIVDHARLADSAIKMNVDTVHSNAEHPLITRESISDIVYWFKTMTTNEYIRNVKHFGWRPFNQRLWQRNYYEHIIRNEQSYREIVDYIHNNPAKWEQDKLYRLEI